MVDENVNHDLPASSETNPTEEASKPLTTEDVKAIIENSITAFLQNVELKQNERNALFLKLIQENSEKINVEKLVREFLNYGEIDNLINYGFIKNKRVKRQLEIDNIQMEKHRLGLIEGRPNFFEFCKYAHCQFEELLNHYFLVMFPKPEDFNRKLNSLRQGNEKMLFEAKYTDVNYCDYSQKAIAFNLDKNITLQGRSDNSVYAGVRLTVTKVRNEYAHRNSSAKIDDDKVLETYPKVREQLKELKEKRRTGAALSEEETSHLEQMRELETDYFFIEFIRKENWNTVRNSIQNLATLISKDATFMAK